MINLAENKKDIAWDLSQVFPNIDDPSINKTLEKLSEKVTSLERKYKGNITSLDTLGLQELLQDFEDYLKDQQEIRIYANLSYAANMIDAKIFAEIFGLDVTDPEFWKLGIKRYESFVNQLEQLLIDQ